MISIEIKGIANRAPIIPRILLPVITASIINIGFNPTAFCMIFGTSRLFSNACITMYESATITAIVGEIVNATIIAGTDEIIGPIVGIISNNPAITAKGRAKFKPKIVNVSHVKNPIEKQRMTCPLNHAPSLSST